MISSPRDFVASLRQFRSRIPLSPGFARFTRTIPFENPSLSGICSLRSHNSVRESLSLWDLLVSLAQFRSRIPLSLGFAHFARTIPFENPSLSGICSLRSHIPPRLRRGDARCEIKNGVQEGIWSLRFHIPFYSPLGPLQCSRHEAALHFFIQQIPF